MASKKATKKLKKGKKLQSAKPLSRANIELDSWSFGASNS